MVKKPSEADEDRGLRMPLGPSSESRHPGHESQLRTFVRNDFTDSVPPEQFRFPSLPPSYEEAVKAAGPSHARAARQVKIMPDFLY
jgi:hypothetical protein